MVAGLCRLGGEHPRQKGGQKSGPNPTDKGKPGSKRHLLVVDRGGVPLAVMVTTPNVHDSMMFEELVDAIEPPIKLPRGTPRKRPEKLHADKAYDDDKKCKQTLRKRGIKSRIARKGVESSERATGEAPVGGGANAAGVGWQVPQAHGPLRATR